MPQIGHNPLVCTDQLAVQPFVSFRPAQGKRIYLPSSSRSIGVFEGVGRATAAVVPVWPPAHEAAPRAVRRFRSNLPAGMNGIIAPVEIESCLGFE